MRVVYVMSVLLISMLLLSGCFYAHVITPLDTNVDRTVLGQKTGKAMSQSVLWAVAWGDAGTAAAAKNGGITTVNHMDREFLSVLFGIYTETITIVYGD
ncbi:MAG TPA: TRL domain-containing protein [Nitrospirota bacterium]|nr:TRL domain-containing protein [Nitrospirota bacterium]